MLKDAFFNIYNPKLALSKIVYAKKFAILPQCALIF